VIKSNEFHYVIILRLHVYVSKTTVCCSNRYISRFTPTNSRYTWWCTLFFSYSSKSIKKATYKYL